MKSTILPVVSLATALLACAHDPASARNAQVASAEQRDEARSEEYGADRDERAAQSTEQRVESAAAPQRGADRRRVASNDGTLPVAQTDGTSAQDMGHAPDNTAVNERDRNNANVTPMDQGNGEVDVDLTQRIRKAVMADESLSFTAKNAKIITRAGRVTLRGPVNSAAEKDAVYKYAVSAAGVGHVSNELEVAAK